jgi:hypothetical protein
MLEAGKMYNVEKTNKKTGRSVNFTATINWVEDRGDYWYIGYKPADIRICRFGACRVKKSGEYAAINFKFKEV